MTIVGFGLKDIKASKQNQAKDKVNIESGLHITSVERSDFSIHKDEQAIKFSFKFTCNYEPKIGSIALEGDFVFLIKKENADKLLDQWTKKKILEKEYVALIYPPILAKCQIQALLISRDLGLPSPIPLPKFKVE